MRAFVAAVVIFSASLSGCASLQPTRVPTATELEGTYYMGDGLGICMEVTLYAGGTLSGSNCAGEHINLPSRAFAGSWSLAGEILTIKTPGGELKDSEAFFWHGKPAFVELENKRGNRVEPWAVFHKPG